MNFKLLHRNKLPIELLGNPLTVFSHKIYNCRPLILDFRERVKTFQVLTIPIYKRKKKTLPSALENFFVEGNSPRSEFRKHAGKVCRAVQTSFCHILESHLLPGIPHQKHVKSLRLKVLLLHTFSSFPQSAGKVFSASKALEFNIE